MQINSIDEVTEALKNGEIVMALDCQSILWNILEFIQKTK